MSWVNTSNAVAWFASTRISRRTGGTVLTDGSSGWSAVIRSDCYLRLVPDGEVDRGGDEAAGAGFGVQSQRGFGHAGVPHGDPGPQHDLGQVTAAARGLGHRAVRVVGITGHHPPGVGA